MNKLITFTLLPLIAVIFTLAAPTANADRERLSDYTVSPTEPHGRIVGSPGRQSHDIFPLSITHINGARVTGERDVLWLKPGEYKIRATIMPSAFQRGVVRATRIGPASARMEVEPLHLVVEEGKSYHIGGLHLHREEGKRRQGFQLVLWKVEDGEEIHHPDLHQDREDESDDS